VKLLLDEDLSPELAEALVRAGIEAVALQAWEGGRLLGAGDDRILAAATADGRILLTADRRSLMPLLSRWAEEGRSHGGIIIVPGSETHRERIGGTVRALTRLAEDLAGVDWANRFVGLPPA
jgi:hypothetical protein